MYTSSMADRTSGGEPLEIGVSDLRAELAHWLRVAREREVVITDRGRPVARLVPVDEHPGLRALIEQGAVVPPRRAATPVDPAELVRARGSVSDLIDRR